MTRLLSPGPVRLGPEDIDASDSGRVDIVAGYAALEPPPLRRAAGRPSLYTEELGVEICRRMGNGETLEDICKQDGFPERITVWRWCADHPEFNRLYLIVRRGIIEGYADQMLKDIDGCNNETLRKAVAQCGVRQWLMSNPAITAVLNRPDEIVVSAPGFPASDERALAAVRRPRLVAVT